MGWASRRNSEEQARTAYIVFPTDDVRDEYYDFMRRTRALLEIAKTFMDAGLTLDENAPDFDDLVAPHVENFFVGIMLNYPSLSQIEADLETLSQVRALTDLKK